MSELPHGFKRVGESLGRPELNLQEGEFVVCDNYKSNIYGNIPMFVQDEFIMNFETKKAEFYLNVNNCFVGNSVKFSRLEKEFKPVSVLAG